MQIASFANANQANAERLAMAFEIGDFAESLPTRRRACASVVLIKQELGDFVGLARTMANER